MSATLLDIARRYQLEAEAYAADGRTGAARLASDMAELTRRQALSAANPPAGPDGSESAVTTR